jgi:hypothetical protein
MLKFLLPRQPEFFHYFRQLNDCLKEMTALSSEFVVSFKDFENFCVRAEEIEHRADTITHTIVDTLNQTFVTPFDREDMYALAHTMDDVIDLLERNIKTIHVYQVTEKKANVDEFISLAVEASAALDKLVRECFKQQKHTSSVNQLIVKIHELEDRGDSLHEKSIRKLFNEEKDPAMLVKWKDIYENLENIMDKFQRVSDAFGSIIVKSN